MSDTQTQDNRRRRSRGGRGNRPSQSQRPGKTPRAGVTQPSGFQKFLSAISFGLLGKTPKLPVATPAARPPRTESARPPRQRREAPPPANPAEVNTERLYVGNLSYDASESDLFELFSGVGSVRNSEVVVNNRTQRSKGFAFVTMASVDEARRAVQELGGKDFMGRPLQISGAKPVGQDERKDAPGPDER